MSESTPDQVAQSTPAETAPAKPAVRVNLDLDALERDPAEANREPFAFAIGGRPIILTDPAELDWEEVMALQTSPHELLNLAMSKADRVFMRSHRVPVWKARSLAESYMAYYDLTDAEGNVV